MIGLMRRLLFAGVFVFVLVTLAPAVEARAAVTKPKAIASVRAVLKANAVSCGYRVVRITASRTGRSWRVVAVTSGSIRGSSTWTVARGKPRPSNALAKRIRAGCPDPSPPSPPPPTPPVEPPLSGPGAPATYVFGSEVRTSEQENVRRGFDIGARYYRIALGRELPPFTVYAYNDVEAIIRAYAQHEPSSSPEHARLIWGSGYQVAHATPRKVWFGPSYFVTGRPSASVESFGGLQIAAHEAFHLFQLDLVGQQAMSVSGIDQIPTAGPWWLHEGVATYFAQLAVVREGLLRLSELQQQWKRSTRSTGATLDALATLRGQQEVGGAYHIYTLATELLLSGRDPKLVFAYYEAIGRGVAWPDAFAATFGRTHAAFVQEFEAYRRTL
jgi:hypothetical protein